MELIEKDNLIMREAVGTATDGDGVEYEICTNMNRSPLVKSLKTGRTFSLSWDDILEMAIQKGINEEPKEGTCDSSNG